jgi:hypothetical protein
MRFSLPVRGECYSTGRQDFDLISINHPVGCANPANAMLFGST